MLEVADLARRYGDVVALDGLSFTVEPGQLFGFVGPNGAGKTTTMRIILGVLEPDARRGALARAAGRPRDAGALRLHAGGARAVPEDARARPARLLRVAARARARPTRARRPTAGSSGSGIAERAGDRVETLSLGNQQRVQLGVALVHGPELLVLDEPFSGLDPVGVDVLSGVLRELADEGVPVRLLLATSSSWSSGCASRWRSSRTAGSWRRAGSTSCARRARAPRPVRVAVQGGGEDGSGACRAPRWSTAGRRRARRAARRRRARGGARRRARRRARVTHFALERPTLSRAVPQGGGGVSGLAGARGGRARRAARDHAEAAREVVPHLDGRDGGDHRARRRDPGAARGRRRRPSSRSATTDAASAPDRRRGQAGARLRRRGEGALAVARRGEVGARRRQRRRGDLRRAAALARRSPTTSSSASSRPPRARSGRRRRCSRRA